MFRTDGVGLATGAAAACALLIASGPGQAVRDDPRITVREGTSMAIALSPDKSRVAIDLQGSLWLVPIGGGAATRITDEYGDVRQPAWSPDGRTIAFQSYRDGAWKIWTVGIDGSGLTPITSGPFDDREPHWSPDGSQVAFSSDRGGNYDIWVLDRASGAVRRITTNAGNDFFPSWSPTGREIAFVSTRTGSPGVYAVTPDGTERLIAASAGGLGAPSWSPDGKVLFSVGPVAGPSPIEHDRQLVLDGQAIAAGGDYFPFRAAWLSDDEFLYPADGRIKRRSLRRGEQPPIEFSATLGLTLPAYKRKRRDFDSTAEQRALGIMRPVVSLDGTRLAFAALGDLWTATIGATGVSAPARLTDDVFVDTDPAWSPDGTRLAFTSDRAGGMDIWIRDLRTGGDRRLTSLPDAEMAPAWSPDGRSIVFVANQAYEQGELYVVPADGGEPRKIHDRVFGVGYPSWTSDGRFVITSAVKPYSTRYRESMNYYWTVPVAPGGDATAPAPAGRAEQIERAEMIVPDEHVPIGKRAGDGPAISPDGRTLAYVSNGYLFVRPIDAHARPTGPARQITRELSDAISWAGSGHVLYMAIDRLKLVSIADGTARELPLSLTWRRKIAAGRKVVHAGRLIDGVQPTARLDMDVVIENNRIVAIAPHRDALHAGVTVVDASTQSVMPGLIEGHGHTLKEHGDLFGRVHLAYGVTGFRDVGGMPYDELESKEAIESGRRVGPTVFTTGYLLDGRRPYYPMASTAPDATVVDMELERARRLDYDMFKTYVRLPDLLQKRAIEGAHRLGIPTSSHEIYPAALAGGDSVEHAGATSRRGYSTKQSPMGRAYEDVLQIIAKSGMTITPTLALGGFQTAVAANPSILDDPRWRLLQPPWTVQAVRARQGAARGQGGITEGQRTVLALHRAGARIIAGVDSPLTPYGTALHTELRDFVAAGLSPFEALKTATINPARLIGVADDLGTLEAGKLADLVIVDGNPLVDIADTRRVRTVIRHGMVFTVEQLLNSPPSPSSRSLQNLQNVRVNPTFTTRGARISAGAR
jgi:Tol biopolymer transport system component/imidazolonepropionase-like amidohydrolase